MPQSRTAADPFALMTQPEQMLAALAASDRLACLSSRICRPLDRPLIARTDGDAAGYDELVDSSDVLAPSPTDD